MESPAPTPRGTPASGTLPDRLLHTFFVLSATSLTLILALFAFLLTLLLKITAIRPMATGRSGRRVKFVERTIVIPPTAIPQRKPDNSIESSPALVEAPSPTLSLSLTVTPRELEPRTPDVVEDPLQAIFRVCGFLAANTARAWRHEELAPTPPLAGLEPYLAAVQRDLEMIDQTGKDDEDVDVDEEEESEEGEESEGEEEEGAAAAEDSEVQVLDREDAGDSEDSEAGAGEAAGSGSSADARDRDEPGLVLVPDQATSATSPPSPLPSQIPTPPAGPDTSASAPTSASTSTSTPIPAPAPEPTPPSPTTQNTSLAEQTDTTATPSTSTTRPSTPTPTPQPPTMRRRRDAVLRTTRPSGAVLGQLAAANSNPDLLPDENAAAAAAADRLADSDDAAVRAAALFSRVADLGTGLFEGTVRERGAALWAALSRSRGRGTPSEVPVPPLTRTRFATGVAERS